MQRVRLILVGGFLGAGKTTMISRLAHRYIEAGRRVGVVTNDQAFGLVDTMNLRAQGLDVGEVAGACFCCKFNDLVETAAQLAADVTPDVILCEPVGSCTDLVATVIEPLRSLYQERFETGPLVVLLKPEHGRKILSGGDAGGFSPKAEYIFLKQLEEADVVVINKADKLSPDERDELVSLVQDRFTDKEVLTASARQGWGLDELSATIGRRQRTHVRMEVDYDIYAEGEAELGWLNAAAHLVAQRDAFGLDDVLLELLSGVQNQVAEQGGEIAHLKVLGTSGAESAVANLVSSDVDAELSLASQVQVREADLTINARVAMAPDELEAAIRHCLSALSKERGIDCAVTGVQCFRPARPEPTHRMGAS